MSEQKLVNLRPDAFTKGGGLADDFDGTVTDARFVMTDYNGNLSEPIPAARIVFDVDGDEVDQVYSVGGTGDFAPDDTGMSLVQLKSRVTLNESSKFGLFLAALVKVGFPITRMENQLGYLLGLNGHWVRSAVEYKGLKQKGDRDNTVLVCTKINQLPWDSDGGKGKAKGKAGKSAAASTLADPVAEIITGVIVENGGEVTKKALMSALFKDEGIVGLGAEKTTALKLAADDTYLGGRSEWVYADGVLTMG